MNYFNATLSKYFIIYNSKYIKYAPFLINTRSFSISSSSKRINLVCAPYMNSRNIFVHNINKIKTHKIACFSNYYC